MADWQERSLHRRQQLYPESRGRRYRSLEKPAVREHRLLLLIDLPAGAGLSAPAHHLLISLRIFVGEHLGSPTFFHTHRFFYSLPPSNACIGSPLIVRYVLQKKHLKEQQ